MIPFPDHFTLHTYMKPSAAQLTNRKPPRFNNDWEITVSKNNNRKPVINSQPLFNLRNIGPESSGC